MPRILEEFRQVDLHKLLAELAHPIISVFYGTVISMRWREHGLPHFHAAYGDAEVSIGINPLAVLRSTLMPRQLGLVMEWAAQHQDELSANWDRAQERGPLAPIAPLP